MKSRFRPLVLAFSCASVFMTGACATSVPPSTSSSARLQASPSPLPTPSGSTLLDAAVTMPAGFPADFPIYPGARLTQADNFTATPQTSWAVVWETLDGVGKVQAFYSSRLAAGDWTLSFTGGSASQYAAVFARKSNSRVGGVLGAENSSKPGVTKITVALTTV